MQRLYPCSCLLLALVAWGYGGQFIFVLPALKLTVVTTSQSGGPRDVEHLGAIFELLRETIVPSAASDT